LVAENFHRCRGRGARSFFARPCGRAGASRLPLERSSLRDDCAAVLGAGVAPPNSLRSLRSLRSDSRGESVHEARCARRPRPLRSSPFHRSPRQPHPAPGAGSHRGWRAACGPRLGHSAWGGARRRAWASPRSTASLAARDSAHRHLTRGGCPSAANAVSEASSATGQGREHRRAAVAQRRPTTSRAAAHRPVPTLGQWQDEPKARDT
jgi:hypothetical protein